jgi:GntR family transcriptional regulator
MPLNRQSPIPLYYQLAESLVEKIREGDFKPGDQLPSERELTETYGISRMTVRQGINYLMREGQLVARQGLGTFVAEPKMERDPLHLLGFTEEMMLKGVASVSQVLEQVRVVPPTRVALALGLHTGEEVIKIVRLRLSNETPLLLETVFIPTLLCPELEQEDFSSQSLYSILEKRYSLALSHAKQTLEATSATQYEGELFSVPSGTGMVLLEGVTYLNSEQPVEYFKAVYRGDRFRFEFESQRNRWTMETSGTHHMSVVMR